MKRNFLIYFFLLMFYLPMFSQNEVEITKDTRSIGEMLKAYGTGIINEVKIIDNREKAASIAETILISVYGRDKIISERPYLIVEEGNCWMIKGNIEKGKLGGVFEIIIDSYTCEIKSLFHGK